MSPTINTAVRHRYALNLRISAVERNLIDLAAAAQGTTRTDCILRAARKAAEEVLLDRALVLVSQETCDEFHIRPG